MNLTKLEVIKLFVMSYDKILSSSKLAPIKFIFNKDAFILFKDVLKYQDTSKYLYKNISIYEIARIKNNNIIKENEIYIKVADADLFFTKLQIIINLYIRYQDDAVNKSNIKDFITNYLWLKMTPYDFLDIYSFLDLQISFLLNSNFFDYDPFSGGKKVDTFENYDVYVMTDKNYMMWETYKRVYFKICDKNSINSYELPSIHYGIANNHTCYIYAIQNMAIFKQDKKISRKLYKYSNDFIHPSFIISLKLMFDLLINSGITDIKIPLLEILNYSYHEFLSNKIKKDFYQGWTEDYLKDSSEEELKEYDVDLNIYNKYVDRVDEISKSKVDTLANIVLNVTSMYDNLDIYVDDYMLNIKLKEKVKKM